MKIYVTNEYTKNRILEECAKNKCFNDGKFFSFSELKKKRFFYYDNKTLEYIMKKYNVNINIAKIYVENFYFLSFHLLLFVCLNLLMNKHNRSRTMQTRLVCPLT